MSAKYLNDASRAAYFEEVWNVVRQIPKGKVSTYGQIASMLPAPEGIDEKSYRYFSPRWVGGAMAACPDDVPWQRVINAQGKISLRTGEGATRQKELLESEGIAFDERDRINLKKFQWRTEAENDQQLELPF